MDAPNGAANPALGEASSPKRSRLLLGCGALIAFLLLVIAVLMFLLWWSQRPIRPVVLNEQERAVVQEKLQKLEGRGGEVGTVTSPGSGSTRGGLAAVGHDDVGMRLDRPYVPGGKVLRLTEREINGLLNQNTDLGNAVRLEFGRDAINAYFAIPIPRDFPIGGGRIFRARGRFLLSLGSEGKPLAVLEDVSVYGLSLPKAWLGGIKGENLLGDVVGAGPRGPLLRGIKSLRLEPGALVLEVED